MLGPLSEGRTVVTDPDDPAAGAAKMPFHASRDLPRSPESSTFKYLPRLTQ